MKVLILRTFNHNRIWVSDKDNCLFGTLANVNQRDLIEGLEPNIQDYLINDFKYALGIYIQKYFSWGNVYSGTPEENTISILKLRRNNGDRFISVTRDNQLKVHYEFVEKIIGDRNTMFKIDSELVKQNEIEKNQRRIIPLFYPLCFSVSESFVTSKTKELYNNN